MALSLMKPITDPKIENTVELAELHLLLFSLNETFGYDFTEYNQESVLRRVKGRVSAEDVSSIAELQNIILQNDDAADALLRSLSINVTEMFRDADFYLALRPIIKDLFSQDKHVKIWHAGCASGEEVYSMAIMLTEYGLYDSCQLYGTDFNNAILSRARQGIFPPDKMRLNSKNYQKAGGLQSFADYYHSNYDGAIMDAALKQNMVYSHHNLANDGVFGEMSMIVCRNVLIYFSRELQKRVIKLFLGSLKTGGVLCLGSHESLSLIEGFEQFEVISSEQRIFRKIG